jgi:hypothetical protein
MSNRSPNWPCRSIRYSDTRRYLVWAEDGVPMVKEFDAPWETAKTWDDAGFHPSRKSDLEDMREACRETKPKERSDAVPSD